MSHSATQSKDQLVLGLDVGGANLKAAHTNGSARSRPFPLWKAPAALPDALRDLLRDWPPYDALALTMTDRFHVRPTTA